MSITAVVLKTLTHRPLGVNSMTEPVSVRSGSIAGNAAAAVSDGGGH